MAGDWIKMRSNLWDDPRVTRLCDITDSSEAQIVGSLYWLWATADQHSADGLMAGLTLRSIDRKTGIQGFGAALVAIGWVVEKEDGVQIVRFEEHNGSSAKRRSSDAQRKASVRKMSAPDADKEQTESGSDVELEKEKRREEVKTQQLHGAGAPVGSKAPDLAAAQDPEDDLPADGLPACPTQKIIDLYHELMPANPRVKVVDEARKRTISARWRQAASTNVGPFGYSTREAGLEAWRTFFEVCSDSDFLTGNAAPGPGRDKPFVADLDFLLSPKGFKGCLENKYHRSEV